MKFGKPGVKAKARKVPGVLSGPEKSYAALLETQKASGVVTDFLYEKITLKLAGHTHYKPDFLVIYPDGTVELVEVKGSWKAPNQDKSRVKLKVAAEQFPWFRFTAAVPIAKKLGGGWELEDMSRWDDEVTA